jgi:hypothetical protein
MQNSKKIGQDDIEQIVNQPKLDVLAVQLQLDKLIGTKHSYVGQNILNHKKHESRSPNIHN